MATVYVHLHGQGKVRAEAKEAMMTMLQEMYRPNDQVIVAPVLLGAPFSQHELPVATEPRHVVQPNTTSGVHFHEVDHVAT